MSYHASLDEISEERLQRELDRRKGLREKGLCDYCERPADKPVCRFPDRHEASRPPKHFYDPDGLNLDYPIPENQGGGYGS